VAGKEQGRRLIGYDANMGKVREYVRDSKVARALVATMGVGSFLGLVFTLTLWAASYVRYVSLESGLFGDYRFSTGVVSGQWWFASFESAGYPFAPRFEVLHSESDFSTYVTTELVDRPYNLEFFRTPRNPLVFNLPLWPVAVFWSLVFATLTLTFRFTIRSLLIVLTVSSLFFAGLGALLQRTR
jgi:hypothetical protein